MTTPTPLPHAVAIEMCSDFDEASQNCGDPNHSPESCTCLKLARAWRKMERDLAAAKEWREAVLNELIVAHIYTKEHDTNPRKAIQDAITWNCQVALDPAVSSDAQKLIAAAQEARQRAEARAKQNEKDAARWKKYLEIYDSEELAAAAWVGAGEITKTIDAAIAGEQKSAMGTAVSGGGEIIGAASGSAPNGCATTHSQECPPHEQKPPQPAIAGEPKCES